LFRHWSQLCPIPVEPGHARLGHAPVNVVLGLDAVAAGANTGATANPPGIHCVPHTKLFLTIFLPHIHLSEVQNRGGGVGSKHSCEGVARSKVEFEEGFIREGDVDRRAAGFWNARSIWLLSPTSCHGKPVHCDDPGIVCPARNPRGRVGGGEDDRGVAVVVHPCVVAEPIVGHDRSVTIRLKCSRRLYPVAVSIFIWSHSA